MDRPSAPAACALDMSIVESAYWAYLLPGAIIHPDLLRVQTDCSLRSVWLCGTTCSQGRQTA